MANTVCRHLLALLSLAILTWTVSHAKALQENEDEVLNLEQRDEEEAKEVVLAERDAENEQEEEAEKRDAENQETETEDEEVQKRNPENEEDKEKLEKREPEIQKDEEAVEKREPEKEAQKETEVEEKREEAQKSEDTEVEDLETRAVYAPFTLVDWIGRRINGQREGLLLFGGRTVCRDHFSMNSAHAICRTMGYMQATRFRYGLIYGSFQSRKRIGLTNVRCTSTHWASCHSTPHNHCNHYKDILLTCQGTGFKLLNSAGSLIHGRREGLLTYQHGTVCDDYFNMNAAHAICRVMGYAYAVRWRHGYYYGMMQRFSPIIMDDVRCSAAFWNRCHYRRIGTHDCSHSEDVFLTCQPGTPHPPGFTLVDWRGHTTQRGCEGLLLYYGGTVCDDYFNMYAAHAICKVLGYRAAVSYRSGLAYGTMQTRKSITMDNVRCRSTTWSSCRYHTHHDCSHSEDILLKCRA